MPNQELLIALKEHLNESLKVLYPDVSPTDSGTCFVMSKIAVKILRKLGYDCREERVIVLLGNEKGKKVFLEQEKKGKFSIGEITKDGGWTIGLGMPTSKEDFSNANHYVVYFPKEKEIMDITFGQARREEKDILASAYWCNENELPEIIFHIIRGVPRDNKWELDRDIYFPKFKPLFKDVVEYGYKKLKRFKK
jgi:hypothetical protein